MSMQRAHATHGVEDVVIVVAHVEMDILVTAIKAPLNASVNDNGQWQTDYFQ